MTDRPKISAYQLIALLFCGRLAAFLTLSSSMTQAKHPTDFIFSLMLSGLFSALFLLPSWWMLHRQRKQGNILGITNRTINGIYAVICLFAVTVDLIRFYWFIDETLTSRLSRMWLCVFFVAIAAAAALYGLEALARCSFILSVGLGIVLILSALLLIPSMRLENFQPLFTEDAEPVIRGAFEEFPRGLELSVLPILLPYVREGKGGNKAIRGGLYWCGWQTFASIGGQLTATGVLGTYMHDAVIPYYSAITMLSLGAISRIDVAVSVLWAAALFVRVALFLWLFGQCITQAFPRTTQPITVSCGAGITILTTLTVTGFSTLQNERMAIWTISTVIIVIGGIILPIIASFCKNKRMPVGNIPQGVKA